MKRKLHEAAFKRWPVGVGKYNKEPGIKSQDTKSKNQDLKSGKVIKFKK
jgi:hypothetical protein